MSSGKVKGIQYYPKINTCFKREMNHESPLYNCILPDEPLTTPEFELFRKLSIVCEATEKVDGECTSIHLIPIYDGEDTWTDLFGNTHRIVKDHIVEVHGKTSAANMRPDEVELLKSIGNLGNLLEVFTQHKILKTAQGDEKDIVIPPDDEIIIFGETYGKKMQSEGNRYDSQKLNFICFDIKIGKIWLQRESIEDICNKLNIQVVPIIGYMTIDEAIEYVRKGFTSRISEDPTLAAEGLVLRAPLGLLTRQGERIITKIKTGDFHKLKLALGE